MKTLLFSALSVVLLSSCISAPSLSSALSKFSTDTPQDSMAYDVKDFNAIDLDGVGRIILTQDNSCSLRIAGDSALLSKTDVYVADSVLHIDQKTNMKNGKNINLNIYISAPAFNLIDIDGVGLVENETPITVDGDMTINFDGVGKMELSDITCQNMTFEQEGIGAAKLDIKCNKLDIKRAGIGSAEVNVTAETLNVSSKDIGSLSLSGTVKNYTKTNVDVTSKIDDKNLKVEQ